LRRELQTKRANLSAVIFAGGKSSRMGRDKSLLPFGDYETMVEYQYRRLEKIFENIAISWKSEKAKFGANSIFDEERFSHISAPTVGLYSILKNAKTDYTFIISVDTPLFCLNNIENLIFKAEENIHDIIASKGKNGVEPLIAIYHKRVLPKVEKMILEDNHKLKNLLNISKTAYVDIVDEKAFINLNYFYEYELAKLKI
jgi:molybdopterin-guanine dinucleotide biosynthesis protein A